MDELLGRRVPHSPEAEQAVIGSMLLDPRCIPGVLEKLKADEFYLKRNRDIFETIAGMFAYGQTVDPVTVLDQMKVRGVYEDGCDAYLIELLRLTPTARRCWTASRRSRSRRARRWLRRASPRRSAI